MCFGSKPVQQVFIDVESHEMRDRDAKGLSGLRKASDFSVNGFPPIMLEGLKIQLKSPAIAIGNPWLTIVEASATGES